MPERASLSGRSKVLERGNGPTQDALMHLSTYRSIYMCSIFTKPIKLWGKGTLEYWAGPEP